MDANLVTVVAILTVAVSQTSETLFPGAFSCCMKISEEIPKGILRRVERFGIQKADGLCHLEAVILYIEGRKFCVSPQIRKVKNWMKKKRFRIHRKNGRRQRRTKIKKKREKKQRHGEASPMMQTPVEYGTVYKDSRIHQ
ncbi:C-C motif chemokine 28 [Struthio camelus]|uniref:C-C motif chemokine 28 n=1 Tax=Struthio camelus TaxID=8801 RepID=UPI00051E176E|nr:PREDICTED: C-C motif chemokine 28 [Struthio camelus australis]